MKRNRRAFWVFFFLMPLLVVTVFASNGDDYESEAASRVARISYLTGDVKIRRAGSDEWEIAVQNLPVVEGDELATDSNALLEIQFDRDRYVRLNRSSYLKIIHLKDKGAALSLTQGSLHLRVLKFDRDDEYFEIDAPKTTVAVQHSGSYRIDAGDYNSREVRVGATEKGQARVYSANSSFTLKDGRAARIFIDGDYAGEWEMADASRYFDEFDEWALKRDTVIAKRLRDAYYDRYYDRDIYGAEDLNAHGDWIYTRDYGYVWRPRRSALSDYDNWSPFRYGHWRWVPYHGWTWVNDEPWGWATYHHGRWVFFDGYWAWTPYGYYRARRSGWQPALVVIANINNDICWYPLPYRARSRRYHNQNRVRSNNPPPVAANPTPVPTAPAPTSTDRSIWKKGIPNKADLPVDIPPTAVVAVPADAFGRIRKGFKSAPPSTAKTVLAQDPDKIDSPPLLPTIQQINPRMSSDIRTEKPSAVKIDAGVPTGAARRTGDVLLDKDLREKRIFGNRSPLPANNDRNVPNPSNNNVENPASRPTGAVTRPPAKAKRDDRNDDAPDGTAPAPRSSDRRPREDKKTRTPPVYEPPVVDNQDRTPREPVRQPKRDEPRYTPPPRKQDEPRSAPPPREEPRYTPPPRREEPKYEPPPKRDEPPPRREPSPPAKSEPRSDSKPDSPEIERPSKKDKPM